MLEYTDYLKFVSTFVIIVIFLYAVYYFINHYGKGLLPGQKGLIKILDIRYISKGKGFAIIEANKHYFLIAFDEKEIKVLKEWDRINSGDLLSEKDEKDNP
ncbi:hypothetical protein [Persephonella sp.]